MRILVFWEALWETEDSRGAARRVDSGAGKMQFLQRLGRSRVQFEWFRLSVVAGCQIVAGRSLPSRRKTVNLLKEPVFDVGTTTVGAATVREWLLRADQSIRANRLLTRAAQAGADGWIGTRGKCSSRSDLEPLRRQCEWVRLFVVAGCAEDDLSPHFSPPDGRSTR